MNDHSSRLSPSPEGLRYSGHDTRGCLPAHGDDLGVENRTLGFHRLSTFVKQERSVRGLVRSTPSRNNIVEAHLAVSPLSLKGDNF